MGKKLYELRAKTNSKPELKVKVVWITSERELGRIKSDKENYEKKFVWKIKTTDFREIYVIFSKKYSL